jgi:farnesyl-diphosphate farnesyltransferase
MLPPKLNELLKQTSRTFYQTLRVLPGAVRPQISLAYLLARTSDTIADTEIVPAEQRLEALDDFRQRIIGARLAPVNYSSLAKQQGSPAERELLEHCELSLACLRTLSPADLERVIEVLSVIVSGQEQDLRRFAGASESVIAALQTEAELDDYTYRVAGCVGEFWTKMCRAHLFPDAVLGDSQFIADGVRFGKGLQLVNILRDLPVDLRKGRCYLPMSGLSRLGLSPADLLSPANESRLRPLYNSLLDLAHEHLTVGWRYTNTIPRGQMRVRLACAWPILIGERTLAKLRGEPVLDPQRRVKVSRDEVKGILVKSVIKYPFATAWERQFAYGASAGKAVA